MTSKMLRSTDRNQWYEGKRGFEWCSTLNLFRFASGSSEASLKKPATLAFQAAFSSEVNLEPTARSRVRLARNICEWCQHTFAIQGNPQMDWPSFRPG